MAPKWAPDWDAILAPALAHPTLLQLKIFLADERRAGHEYLPAQDDVFQAFQLTAFHAVRVVILGQDPYPTPGHAHGLAFSVRPKVGIPRSLANIFKELHADLGIEIPAHGHLGSWAAQGILLLNSSLTTRPHAPGSHARCGWEHLTGAVLKALVARDSPVLFLAWGRHAQALVKQAGVKPHDMLAAPHPSPFSAASGFFGCRHFSQTNTWLKAHGLSPIDWALPASVSDKHRLF